MRTPTILAQTSTAAENGDGAVDVSPVDQIINSVDSALKSFFSLLPKIALAAIVLAVFVIIGRVVRKRVKPRLAAARTPSFGEVFSTLIYVGIVIAGLVIALPIAFPSLSIATMLGGLGLLGVAAGFAFQDILSNLLAGVLLIFRQPFVTGDQIAVGDLQGTVQGITIRETRIKTFDGRLIVVPNAEVYTNAIEVQTGFEWIRTSFVTGVAYGTDLDAAREVALETLAGIDGILDEPAPQAYYTEHGASSVVIDLRYWTSSQQAEVRRIQDQVAQRIHDAYEAAGVDIPFDIVTLDTLPSFDEAMAASGQHAGDGRAEVDLNLDGLSRAELYELAQDMDVSGRSGMSKAELAAAIRRHRLTARFGG